MKAIGFLGGPICVALLGFYFLGELGGAYFAFFFVAPATAIFLPIFMLGASIVGPHLIRLLLLANTVPLGFVLMIDRLKFFSEPQLFHSIPFLAASFCATFYWICVRSKVESHIPQLTLPEYFENLSVSNPDKYSRLKRKIHYH
jgi:hypothetical protein